MLCQEHKIQLLYHSMYIAFFLVISSTVKYFFGTANFVAITEMYCYTKIEE